MSEVLAWDPLRHSLAHTELDQTHQAFIRLLNQAASAGKDQFVAQLQQLLEHTQQHFADEEQLMQASNFPSLAEHQAEHRRVLGELQQLATRAQQGRSTLLARAYVRDKLPEWFNLHTATMDSALVAHLHAV